MDIFHRSPEGNYYETAMLDGPLNLRKFLIPATFVSTRGKTSFTRRRRHFGQLPAFDTARPWPRLRLVQAEAEAVAGRRLRRRLVQAEAEAGAG